ncbi:MAG: MFS transporter [Proteobacteria bacterium]|nr:MFS transporter [Pseudomonadota bacterium]
MKSKNSKPLLIAFFTIFLDLLGFGIMIPIQPFYVENFGATATQVTLLGASYSLMQFLFAPFWGRLSDRVGRRPIILFSVAVSAVGHLVFGLAQTLATLFAARMLAGFGNANLGTAQAVISDVTKPEDRAKGMGLIGAAFGLGFIIGPAIGGILGQYSPVYPAFFAAGLAVCNLGFAAFMLPETLKKGAPSTPGRRLLSLAALKHAARQTNVATLFTMTFVYTLGFAIMEQVIGLFIEKIWVGSQHDGPTRLQMASQMTAVYLVVVGFTAVLIQGFMIGRLTKKFGEQLLAKSGLVLLTLAMISIPLAGNTGIFPVMVATAVILAAGSGIFNPSNSSMVSRAADPSEQGSTLGLNQSIASLGRVLGPASAGAIFELNPSWPFYAAGSLTALAAIISTRLKPVARTLKD